MRFVLLWTWGGVLVRFVQLDDRQSVFEGSAKLGHVFILRNLLALCVNIS